MYAFMLLNSIYFSLKLGPKYFGLGIISGVLQAFGWSFVYENGILKKRTHIENVFYENDVT